eukprot:Hpha_TRINITY_DN15727_c3_g1::TRINITY_DN15727_c3_g1_i1::g.38801::m.38801
MVFVSPPLYIGYASSQPLSCGGTHFMVSIFFLLSPVRNIPHDSLLPWVFPLGRLGNRPGDEGGGWGGEPFPPPPPSLPRPWMRRLSTHPRVTSTNPHQRNTHPCTLGRVREEGAEDGGLEEAPTQHAPFFCGQYTVDKGDGAAARTYSFAINGQTGEMYAERALPTLFAGAVSVAHSLVRQPSVWFMINAWLVWSRWNDGAK